MATSKEPGWHSATKNTWVKWGEAVTAGWQQRSGGRVMGSGGDLRAVPDPFRILDGARRQRDVARDPARDRRTHRVHEKTLGRNAHQILFSRVAVGGNRELALGLLHCLASADYLCEERRGGGEWDEPAAVRTGLSAEYSLIFDVFASFSFHTRPLSLSLNSYCCGGGGGRRGQGR